MSVPDLIGKVVALYLKEDLADDRATTAEGTARYIVDCLTAEQTGAIARQILADPGLSDRIDMKLPARLVDGQGLPPHVQTTYPATFFRNAAISKPVLLVANTGDDEAQSLKEFTRLGAPEIQERPALWVRVAGEGLNLSETHAVWWEKAICGLQELRIVSLDHLASFILATREAVLSNGLPILSALGHALPALRFPRDSVFSNRVKEASRGRASAWKAQFAFVAKNRACFLRKQTPAPLVLSEDDLSGSFERVKDAITEAHHPVIRAFIHAPSGWNGEAASLALAEWEEIKPLFDGLKREKFNLAQETIHFYDEREPELLTAEERGYLGLLHGRSTGEATEDDCAFYEAHRSELKDDRKLRSAWDRFIFGKPTESEDFLAGIVACMEALFNRSDPGTNRRLSIRCDRATKKDLRELNVEAGLFFARRYAGLRSLLGSRVSWNVGQLFEFPKLVDTWLAQARAPLTRSTAKTALQLKFVLELEVDPATGGTQSYTTQLVWKFNPNTVSAGFCGDWARLEEHPLVLCHAGLDSAGSKGGLQTVDLANVRTFVPAFGRDRGSFVPVYRRAIDLSQRWRSNLEEARSNRFVTAEVARGLAEKFAAFEASYTEAIRGLPLNGAGQECSVTQLALFAALLNSIVRDAKGDRNRELLLKPLLLVGTVGIEGGAPATIVAPWHPLRLAALHHKAQLATSLIQRLLTAEEVFFGDTRLFFKDLAQDLAHPFYPEIVLGWQGDRPEVRVFTDCVGDYTLHESPVLTGQGTDDTNENPTDGSNCVRDLVQRYLALHPHEQANMSVVLYNCDSARLPQAVVDRLGLLYEDEEDVRCQVLLRHSDANRLRDLYRAIVETSDTDADAFNPSEATQDFMARLRICIIADQAPPPDPKDGCPFDVVFSQDVIARHSQVEWFLENAQPLSAAQLIPARWSRRRPAARDDMKSVVYLCCPVQTQEGWTYLTAITTFLKGDWDENEARRLLPARQLDFRDQRTARIFEETHNLGNWVVNYDELLDRRQLLNQNVRIIRFKQSATQGRNVIISSKASLGLLRSMVLNRCKDLNLNLSEDEYRTLADRFISDANDVSGDIVLRAAKHGRNASELMGIVLSRYLLRHELGPDRIYGWYFLDDYADWLGQREEQIADILALSPEIASDGQLRLAVLVAESKYVESSAVASKRKESQKQLRDTMRRIDEAVFGSPERLDRELWLARLSDLILDGVQFPASARVNLSDWRRAVREGSCEIAVRGYSHIFVSDPTEAAETSAFCRVTELEEGYQEVFGRGMLREIALAYLRDDDPLPVRKRVAEENIWTGLSYRRPTAQLALQIGSTRAAASSPKPRTPSMTPSPTGATSPPEDRREGEAPARGGQGHPAGGVGDATATSASGSKAKSRSGRGRSRKVTPPTIGETAEEEHEETAGQADMAKGNANADFSSGSWSVPGISALLRPSGPACQDPALEVWLRQTESMAKHALQQFHLQARLLQNTLTPNCVLLKFAGSANLTVEQVNRRRSELLTTYGLPVAAVRPEPGAVTIAIARPTREVVHTEGVWPRWRPTGPWGNQDLLVGIREDDGSLLLLSPGRTHAPHTLIAGSTGSGKSVLMQNILLCIAATNTPQQARVILIDPKQGVDYFAFDGLPHLDSAVIVEQDQALARLEALVVEMDERYRRLRAARVPNLTAFNAKAPTTERMPVIWVIHDEFAEWMMVEEYKERVTATVSRLGVKARAAGIHLVFAAQRPDANVMPMQLRANLGNRLILKVDSVGTSEISLGEVGAEQLLGHGHMIARLEGAAGLCYAQVPLAEPDLVESMVRLLTASLSRDTGPRT